MDTSAAVWVTTQPENFVCVAGRLDLQDSDVWGSSLDLQRMAEGMATRGRLEWLGLVGCSWLDHSTLLLLKSGAAHAVHHSLPPLGPPEPSQHGETAAVESWEDLCDESADACDGIGALRLPSDGDRGLPRADGALGAGVQPGEPQPASATGSSSSHSRIDYSSGRPRQVRSIYHISQGSQPLYGDASATPRTGGGGLSL